jgi:hypothetical protein
MALIVEDKPGDEVETAEEVVLVVQLFDIAEFEEKSNLAAGTISSMSFPKIALETNFSSSTVSSCPNSQSQREYGSDGELFLLRGTKWEIIMILSSFGLRLL